MEPDVINDIPKGHIQVVTFVVLEVSTKKIPVHFEQTLFDEHCAQLATSQLKQERVTELRVAFSGQAHNCVPLEPLNSSNEVIQLVQTPAPEH